MEETAGKIIYGKWLPPDLSSHGYAVDRLIFLLHILMFLLFVGWGIFFVYCMVKFRKSVHPKAQYEPIHGSLSKVVEIGVIVAELVLLFVLSLPAWAAYRIVPKDLKDPVKIRVVAQQFAWNIQYPGPDGKFGKSRADLVSDSNPIGLDPDDPDGKDDVTTINQLHIPKGKPIVVYIRSKDVIHSFFIPVLRVKQDAVPGMEVAIWFDAKQTGKYEIACAQLCGQGHYKMKGEVQIHEPDDFTKWLGSANATEEFEEKEN
ncbi:cytochrome c oxidase subunit II [Candidatus Sumerlaeota bacterium]|nr:cytochrome c oxidase subunit II [Candidatus Sumerlaeota bacterium]